MLIFTQLKIFLVNRKSVVSERYCCSFGCVQKLKESITGEISGTVTTEIVVASEVDLMCADKHNSSVEFQLCALEHGNRNSMNDPGVVNEAKTRKDKVNQGAVSLNYCRPEDLGLRDLPVREPDVTDPGCGAVLADKMSAGAGGYLPEGWLILGEGGGVPVQHHLEDRGCELHLRNHQPRHRSGGRRRGRDQRHRNERWQQCHRSGHHLRGLPQICHRQRGCGHRLRKEGLCQIDIDLVVSVVIDISGKD